MKILAIDTSSMSATCAVVDDEKLLVEYTLNHKLTHSQKIMPIIKEALDSCSLKPEDIDVYAVAKGPGSFTGLRIGVATVNGLAQATDKRVVGVSTLDALAFNLPYCEGIVVPIMDARRDRVFTGIYKWVNGNLHIIKEQTILEVKELMEVLSDRPEKIVFVGDGTYAYKDILSESLGEKAIFAPKSANMARASSVAELAMVKAKEGKTESFFELVPDYLRESQAQREYNEKHCLIGDKNE
ncbi:tRNA (adenosine(37)-N6)-threonylcarbamoyltransferase complex dimerization subunit type 1 TsaB [Proteiniborus sp.]|uniref:tRNA (adenosine(37)-N6)-threonylcarbamoyltransferase complex dimerization subunit type 1 TsaB n=1 Tax=Proteiniborus sp. TaxID=2079015 RepID=UPI00331E882E